MKAESFEEYRKNGCNFNGKLIVVHYLEDAKKDPKWGTFGAELTFDYLEKARALIKELGYNVVRELLSVPDYVVEVR